MRQNVRIGVLLLTLVPLHWLKAQDSTRACPATYADAEASDANVRATTEPLEREGAAERRRHMPTARLSVTYIATSQEAAVDLAHWWAAQPKVGVEVRESPGISATELAMYAEIRTKLPPGATFTPAASSCPAWLVQVEGEPGALSNADVSAWFARLREVPLDRRWKLKGVGFTDPAP